ncbi:MAG: peptidylprolyl isomerase [Blastocatellia bacterium AA13]|nr:MAG: peptidylprolyl isomerase [Blastocatellia bacterium AA13]
MTAKSILPLLLLATSLSVAGPIGTNSIGPVVRAGLPEIAAPSHRITQAGKTKIESGLFACNGSTTRFEIRPAIAGQSHPSSSQAILLDPKNSAWKQRAPEIFRARFETSKGSFIIEAHREWAPIGVNRFYNLIRAGFFDGSRFFRVRAGFIAQFGLPGEPAIARAWRDQAIPDDPVRQSNKRGFISYAMTGPNTRTTQLFVNLADNSRLDGEGFAPIGKVVDGMEVIDSLYSGYGEASGGGMRGGKQARLFEEGAEYLDREFPKLDRLLRCRIEPSGK